MARIMITSAAAECAGGVAAGVVDASGPLGYLAEGVRTNLILQSQTFDNAAWDVSTVSTIVADQTAAPDGTATADKLVEAAVTNNHFVRTTTGVTVTNGVVYTFSLFIKKGTRNWFSLSQDGTVKTFFNISTGVVGTVGAGTTATITALPNGWYRCSITFTQSGTTAILYAFNQTTDNEGAYLGVVTDYSYIWGAQLEAASFASSYIPTTTIAVARQADVLTFASAGNTSGTQGAAYAEVATFGATASVTNQVILGDSATNRQILGFTTQTNMRSFDGTNVNDWTISSVAGGAVHKFAASWGGIVESFFEDGAQISPATKPFDGNFDIGTIGIGTSNTSNQPFATIRNIRIYPTPPSASRAQAMTT